MKKALLLGLALAALACALPASAQTTRELDLQDSPATSTNKTNYVDDLVSGFGDYFVTSSRTGAYGGRDLMLRIGRDVKNLFIFITIIYLIIGVYMMLTSSGDEEALKKWRNQIIWSSIAIVVMQSAYSVVSVLFDLDVGRSGGYSAVTILRELVNPFTRLLQTLASFAFLAMAFYAFFEVSIAQDDHEKRKKGHYQIYYSILGFIVVKASEALVLSVYGRPEDDCTRGTFFTSSRCLLEDPNVGDTLRIATTIINFFNSFIAIAVVLLLIYAGFLVLTSQGEEEKLKTAKNILLYIAIGLLLLVASYAIFNFFLLRDNGA
jgi:cytochrome bd-type quinol oxidase subunit 2